MSMRIYSLLTNQIMPYSEGHGDTHMTFLQSLSLVVTLCVIVPTVMLLVMMFPLVALTIFGILLLTGFVYTMSHNYDA
jgi:hypothetical protein